MSRKHPTEAELGRKAENILAEAVKDCTVVGEDGRTHTIKGRTVIPFDLIRSAIKARHRRLPCTQPNCVFATGKADGD